MEVLGVPCWPADSTYLFAWGAPLPLARGLALVWPRWVEVHGSWGAPGGAADGCTLLDCDPPPMGPLPMGC